jgi:hypothetical protein
MKDITRAKLAIRVATIIALKGIEKPFGFIAGQADKFIARNTLKVMLYKSTLELKSVHTKLAKARAEVERLEAVRHNAMAAASVEAIRKAEMEKVMNETVNKLHTIDNARKVKAETLIATPELDEAIQS